MNSLRLCLCDSAFPDIGKCCIELLRRTPLVNLVDKGYVLIRRKDQPEFIVCRREDIEHAVLGTVDDLDVFHEPRRRK